MNRTIKYMLIGVGVITAYNAFKYWHASSLPTTYGGTPPTNPPGFIDSYVTTFTQNPLSIAIGAGLGLVAAKLT